MQGLFLIHQKVPLPTVYPSIERVPSKRIFFSRSFVLGPSLLLFGGQKRPENVAQLRAHIVKLCRALSEDLCRKVVTNARVRLQEVVRQNGGHIEHVLH